MKELKAGEVMTQPVVTVSPDTTVSEIARILVERHISGVPVVNNDGAILGIVSEADLLLKEMTVDDLVSPSRFRRTQAEEETRRYRGRDARDIMSGEPITATEETTVRQLAVLMTRRGINRVPIVRNGKIAGLVTRNDVLKVFLRSDEQIQRAARASLIQDILIDQDGLDIRVNDGIVAVIGHAEDKPHADAVRRLLRRIDGVVDVDISGLRLVSESSPF